MPQFIGECFEQYRNRQTRRNEERVESAYAANKPTLASRISKGVQKSKKDKGKPKATQKGKIKCTHCGRTNHKVEDCYHASKPKCTLCEKIGHTEDQCYSKKKTSTSNSRNDKKKQIADALASKKETHVAEETADSDEETLMAMNAESSNNANADQFLIDPNYDYDVNLASPAYNEDARMYDWLADSGSTNHIACRRDLFSSYEQTPDATVHGVGGKIIQVAGRGTVSLTARYGSRKRILHLENVNYIPSNKYNIFALGRWDSQGRRYQACNGELILFNRQDMPVLKGQKINSNIYKFNLVPCDASRSTNDKIYTFTTNEPKQPWEIWHHRFGHISYGGLKKLYQEQLIDGLTVDPKSPTPDCISCTEAKHATQPFKSKTDSRREHKGELTHMDLWGKYDVTSIGGHQYYLLLVDDATRFVTVYFLKGKHEASEKVKNYLAYLQVRGVSTHAIRVDRGTEFINADLKNWCQAKGMEIQLTAPYSPSQNSIAERMNRTLVELARAMLTASKLPEFLWEPAVAHAAYLRNRAYTTALSVRTPFEGWFGSKPNVSHLREFGAPVWVLLQGQNIARKILPKSKRRAYVGYNDGSKSVLYYNAETRKVLTSRNYVFLTARDPVQNEEIVVYDSPVREGERGEDAARGEKEETPKEPKKPKEPEKEKPTASQTPNSQKRNSRKRKQPDEEPRRTRGVRINYRELADPYPSEDETDEENFEGEDEENFMIHLMAEAGDEFHSLKEAKESPDWPEWEKAIQAELNQLREKGTWELVDQPAGVVPLKNKWVFVLKKDKEGCIVRYKARLVVKGFGQRFGHDYLETHSPVVRIESIRAMLAIASAKKLLIRQMDIKGAYLNGTLKETIYMKQPDGFEDGTGRVCHLIKTLYGLKQSGREWNMEFDTKMRRRGYKRLRADPCVYTRSGPEKIAIITVWVDDLLLFADSATTMEEMKKDIRTEWETTDLGEPSKIVGIEISQSPEGITISQKKSIQRILEKQGLADANTVQMPLDPHIKIIPNPDGNEGDRSNSYAQLLGELQYVANSTRPDIAFAVNRLASYTANPSLQHITAVK